MTIHAMRGSIKSLAALIAVAEVMGKVMPVIPTGSNAATRVAWTTTKKRKCKARRFEAKWRFHASLSVLLSV